MAKLLYKRFASTYWTWKAIKQRCLNPKNQDFHHYGGRGISVCDRWRDSFEAFLGDMGPKPPGRSLDRINNGGNYEPGNCRWATRSEQTRNTRVNRILEFNGERRCLAEWAEILGVPEARIDRRIRLGYPVERALTEESWRGKKLCIRGHARTPDNLGTRGECKSCDRERGHRRRSAEPGIGEPMSEKASS